MGWWLDGLVVGWVGWVVWWLDGFGGWVRLVVGLGW